VQEVAVEKPDKKAAKAGSNRQAAAAARVKPLAEKYVLPPDAVAGSWHMIADSIEGLEQLANDLQERDNEQDKQLGELLLGQVVGLLLERKEREERVSCRASSTVCGSVRQPCVYVCAAACRVTCWTGVTYWPCLGCISQWNSRWNSLEDDVVLHLLPGGPPR
jgi:hypothetical protein